MPSFYIDITQLVHWPGGLTGIPRVMNELSLRYLDTDAIFVVWDKSTGSFYRVDKRLSLNERGKGIFYALDQRGVADSQPGSLQLKHQAVRLAKDFLRPLKTRNETAYAKLRSHTEKLVPVEKGIPVSIERGDSFFVLWGEWADELYRERVVELKVNGVNLIQVVYDMLPIIAPQYSGHSTEAMYAYYRAVLPVSDVVFAISESTKSDIIRWLSSEERHVPEIHVFRLGDDFARIQPTRPIDARFDKHIGDSEFIVCVGTIEARKNHTLLYYTYKLARERGVRLPKLIIVGRRGWHTENIYDLITTDPETEDMIIPMSDISDEELEWLYDHCRFSVYPSFYEGWGLPIAESIAHGKVCASVNTSSMPEVAGELIPYFSPVSSDDCLRVLTELMSDDKLKRAEKKLTSYRPTTWDMTYKQIDAVVREKII